MAKADTPLPSSLPDEIVIREILTRMPPKAPLRCRAVCLKWRRATFTRDFLLVHHARQPTLPLICDCNENSIDIIPFDHLAATVADKLLPVARLGDASFIVEISCDGLLILCDSDGRFSICNPATRQYAPLHQFDDIERDDCTLLGMYPHGPAGEYRILAELRFDYDELDGLYVFTLGSDGLPRPIQGLDAWGKIYVPPVMFHGCLHMCTGHMITVFDTAAESFRQIRPPVVTGDVDLLEIDDTLGMCAFNNYATAVNIWVVQDYEGEIWALKQRVELPFAELKAQFGQYQEQWQVVFPPCDGHVFGLVKFREWLLQIDIDGKLVASFNRGGLGFTPHWLKQSLLPHTFFPTLEGYVVNDSPFI